LVLGAAGDLCAPGAHFLERQPPSPAFVLRMRGERFDLGAALSPAAETHVAAAFDLLKTL
jgi:hypothetical protein